MSKWVVWRRPVRIVLPPYVPVRAAGGCLVRRVVGALAAADWLGQAGGAPVLALRQDVHLLHRLEQHTAITLQSCAVQLLVWWRGNRCCNRSVGKWVDLERASVCWCVQMGLKGCSQGSAVAFGRWTVNCPALLSECPNRAWIYTVRWTKNARNNWTSIVEKWTQTCQK